MKLVYVANIRIPTEKAHGIQIMKMCEVFASYGSRYTQNNLASQDTQIHAEEDEFLYPEITYKIRGACFKIWKQFRGAFKEKVIERSLIEELLNQGLRVEDQKQIPIFYEGKKVGVYQPDMIVNDKVLIELKRKPFLTKEDEKQFWLYLKGSKYRLGLLINFGRKLEIKRRVYDKARKRGYVQMESPSPNTQIHTENYQRQSAYPEGQNQRLSASKIEVELVIPRRFNWIKKDPFEYYGIEKSFKIKRLPCLDLIPLDKYIGHLGFLIESITFFFFLLFYLFFKKGDIFYTRDRFFLPFSFLKKNIVYEAHGVPKHFFLYRLFLKRIKGIIVITHNLKNFFVKKGIAKDKILIAPDAVDLEKFDIKETKEECRKKLNLPLEKKIILYTGHLYKWKGADILAKASEFLPVSCEVYFVGGTTKDIEKFKIQNSKFKIQVIGHRPHSEIPYWLKAADCLVLPNSSKEEISKHWTSPMKMFEYMASKRPIVASDLPSIREILNEKNAVLVEPDNPEALAKGILKILKNKQLADKISQQAFQDVQQYTWQKRAEKILEFITQNYD